MQKGIGLLLGGLGSLSLLAAQPGIQTEIEQAIRESGAEVGLAFRTLDGQAALSLSADKSFHAASTMKVPVMIELFAQARAGLLRIDDALPVRNEFRSIVDGSPYQLEIGDDSDPEVYQAIGKSMTLERLCERMIAVSSNLAANLLIDKLGAENIRKTVQALGGEGMEVLRGVEDSKAYRKGLSNSTTARALLHLLERIARLEAVDAESSRRMIEILKQQEFDDAIPAGLPAGTSVANKTGEITRIHHDAAIVYAPRPFVLVLLVRGIEDRKESAALMARITQILYRATQPGA